MFDYSCVLYMRHSVTGRYPMRNTRMLWRDVITDDDNDNDDDNNDDDNDDGDDNDDARVSVIDEFLLH